MQKFIISAFIVAVVAGDCTLKCPDGYLSFKRTPTAQNSMTSLWCVKTIFPGQTVNLTTAKALCEKDGSVLTTFENDGERLQLSSALQDGLSAMKISLGQMFVDGHRIPQCITQDRTILRAAPCLDPTTAFTTDDKHTDNTFMLQNWADTEPSASFWQQDVESCVVLGISQFEKRNKKLNDVLCDFDKSPVNTNAQDLWNVGVVCGRLPEFQ